MNNLNYNFPGSKNEEKCICLKQLKNEHLCRCKLLNNNNIPDLKYEDIFNGIVQDQKKIIYILNKGW